MKFIKKRIFIILCILIGLISFQYLKNDTTITIHFTKNYKGDNWQNARTGFLWALSYLGADLPKGEFERSSVWKDSCTFILDYSKIGFNYKAQNAITAITDSIKKSESYKKNNYIDLAHLITLLIGSSYHYYAITNTSETYSEFLKNKDINTIIEFPITKSTISNHHRNIKFYASDSILNSFYIAEEGEGSLIDNTFTPLFYETIEIMKNGQLRFATYDRNGILIASTPKKYSSAGKPAKCLWCHEITLSPLFKNTDSIQNHISPNKFMTIIKKQNELLANYRKTLNSDIDYTKIQDHTKMELQYISYMEPSAYKLAQEWNLKETEVKAILKNEKTHNHYEFNYLINLYDRLKIKNYLPYKNIITSDSVRELGHNEINLIR